MLHKDITTSSIHYVQNWSVADTTARDALTVTSDDVGKVCFVTGTQAFYILADDSPMSWTELGGGGGAVNSFSTIAVSGQSNVVADSSTDTLTLVAGTNVTITTNAGTDSITINASGGGGGITLATPVASTSGTSIDFTSIPSGTKQIVVMLRDVSTNGTSNYLIQLGDSGGIETTGYSCVCNTMTSSNTNSITSYSQGFGWASALASNSFQAVFILNLVDSSTFSWTCSGQATFGSTGMFTVIGGKSLSAELDRVRITTVNGTDTFDAGTINIQYQS